MTAPDLLPATRRSIAEGLDDARARLDRILPRQAHAEQVAGAVLMDIRTAAQRHLEGGVPGSAVIERNVLEWRLDSARDPRLFAHHDLRAIVLCSQGYTSSLAAAALHDLGLRRATDVIGGFHAWKDAALPLTA